MATGIEIHDLTKRYGRRIAVDNLSLTVETGEIFGFVGPNGAGKTTTIRILSGLLKFDHGEVLITGKSVQENLFEIKRVIGYMPDEFGVYPGLRTWEYLDFFAACYKIPVDQRPTQIDGLLELVDLNLRRDDPVDQLSRGMKQRLSLARVLIHEPQILILDEPASGLDPRARIEIRELLLELASMGKTIFFSSHILSDVEEICSRVGIIEDGKLVAAGSLEEMQRKIIPERKLKIVILGEYEHAVAILKTTKGVTSIELSSARSNDSRKQIEVNFSGNDKAVSNLLSTLVKSDIPILHFIENGRNLEDLFLSVTSESIR